ncbi:MAG: ABC-F family ATP-binding cassette domain-containing protein [Planctomycetota bacterium]|nr:ABC-F family ATP-binding cassette domain-containing protein [Planctomycetota bacterium]
MSMLLSCQSLSKSFAGGPLFSEVAISVAQGERVGMIGPNGSGKSTLLKILAGIDQPDTGDLMLRKGLRVGYVAQADRFEEGATPMSVVVAAALPLVHDEHEAEAAAGVLLGKAGFPDFGQAVPELSGGWRKRLAITRELARQPDLLLMDEPTNHLDLEGIEWLEELLQDSSFASIIVTHDRIFLEATATRVLELSKAYPQGTFTVDGAYSEFLRRRGEFLDAQAKEERSLAGKVRQDIAWLSRGAKARRTKAKGRIQEAGERMADLAELRGRNAPAKAAGVEFAGTGRQTRNLLVGKGLSKSLGGKPLFRDLDVTLSPGMCLGLPGPNGSGKTTLIRVLTGELEPDAGTVKQADGLRIVAFTQHREALDPRQSLRDALCPIGDTVFYFGRAMHIITWANRFLFDKEQLRVSVGDLSGGEQARILIARLMLQPADLLILDEPTNDLDIPSLEVLEESLAEFPGAILLVTHDRFMLDRLSTHVLGLDGRGNAREYGDFAQWQAARDTFGAEEAAAAKADAKAAKAAPPAPPAASGSPGVPASKRLSYKEQREWDQMEANITAGESEVKLLEVKVSDPKVLADHKAMGQACRELEAAHTRVAKLYARWAELEAKQA